MQHRPRLTPFGRLLVVQRVMELGWARAMAAEAVGVSRATAYKWLRRYRELGEPGLLDRPSRPGRCPHALAAPTVARILQARRRWQQGPHRLAPRLGLAWSTVYGVLRRHGVSRLSNGDRSTGIPIRYVREHPGELLHLDTKKLGRIPLGGGHRFLGRPAAPARNQGAGYDYLHVAVDDCSRLAYVRRCPDESGPTAAPFLLQAASFFAAQGVRIERVLTDRAMAYTLSRDFRQALAQLQARYLVTRPYRPQTSGKAERFVRTLLQEWAYARFYPSNASRQQQLARWLRFYNHRRPHTARAGQAPISVLVNKARGNYS